MVCSGREIWGNSDTAQPEKIEIWASGIKSLGDSILVDAICDRIVHSVYRIEFKSRCEGGQEEGSEQESIGGRPIMA